MQQLTLFDFIPVGNEMSVKKIIYDKINSIEEQRLKDAFGFSLANVLFNEMTDYTSLYDLDADERTIFGTRLQKTLEKHCGIDKGEICDYNIEGFEVELKMASERIYKSEIDGKIVKETNGTLNTGFVSTRQVGHHGLIATYKENKTKSSLKFIYCKLDRDSLCDSLNSGNKRRIKKQIINDLLKNDVIRSVSINRFDYLNKKYKH